MIVLENDDVLHLQGGGYGIYNTATGGDVDEAVPRVLLTLQVVWMMVRAFRVLDSGLAAHLHHIPAHAAHALCALRTLHKSSSGVQGLGGVFFFS